MAGRGKNAKAKRKPVDRRVGPTPEQGLRGVYVSAGMAHKRVAVIDTMRDRGMLTDDEHRKLAHYRDQQALAEHYPLKSCLNDNQGGGSGFGYSAAIVSAMLATSRIERDLGSLLAIARAVAVDDVSLSQWCIAKHGGRERYNDKGAFVAIVPICERKVMDIAKFEIKTAAKRIVV